MVLYSLHSSSSVLVFNLEVGSLDSDFVTSIAKDVGWVGVGGGSSSGCFGCCTSLSLKTSGFKTCGLGCGGGLSSSTPLSLKPCSLSFTSLNGTADGGPNLGLEDGEDALDESGLVHLGRGRGHPGWLRTDLNKTKLLLPRLRVTHGSSFPM